MLIVKIVVGAVKVSKHIDTEDQIVLNRRVNCDEFYYSLYTMETKAIPRYHLTIISSVLISDVGSELFPWCRQENLVRKFVGS